jgi:hypothetical protein
MRLHFKEEPREWRKAALLGLISPAAIIGILRYRRVVSDTGLLAALAVDRAGGAGRLGAATLVPGLLSFHNTAGILYHSSLGQGCPGGALFCDPDSVRMDHAPVGEGFSPA